MDETTTQPEEEKKDSEHTADNTDKGDKPEEVSIIARADAANERLEANIKRQEELMAKQEELMARQMLAGKADAGSGSAKPEEMTPKEYSEKVLSGEIKPKPVEDG